MLVGDLLPASHGGGRDKNIALTLELLSDLRRQATYGKIRAKVKQWLGGVCEGVVL